jgi:hypothetical protein
VIVWLLWEHATAGASLLHGPFATEQRAWAEAKRLDLDPSRTTVTRTPVR